MNIQDPINVRDCYFGGKTNGLVLHKSFIEGEKGYYVDFTSLHPDILKYRRFPMVHPERITDNFQLSRTLLGFTFFWYHESNILTSKTFVTANITIEM